MGKRVLIAVGGTGGHVYPAIALAEQLKKQSPETEVRFIGGGLNSNQFFDPSTYACTEVDCATPSGKSLVQKVVSAGKIAKGITQSRRFLKEWEPDVIVGFGSYHSLPPLVAARFSNVPIVLHEGNRIPGKVNKQVAKWARVTGTQFPEIELPGRSLQIALPLREGYAASFGSKEEARKALGLVPNRFTFLVFGGSQGALSINALFCSALAHVLSERTKNFQVLHLTGSNALTEEIESEYETNEINAVVKEFEPRMDLAWVASDLAVTRAGAMTIAELIEFTVPSILIPYPYAADDHQEANANFVVEIDGAVKLSEENLEADQLAQEIRRLVANDQKRLLQMKRALLEYKEGRRGRDLCSVVSEVAGIRVR